MRTDPAARGREQESDKQEDGRSTRQLLHATSMTEKATLRMLQSVRDGLAILAVKVSSPGTRASWPRARMPHRW